MAKQINARIITKHDSDENWAKAINFIPKEGEIIVYEPNRGTIGSAGLPRLKVGDGITKINSLKFITEAYVEKRKGYDLSKNNFSDKYKEILEEILSVGDDVKFTDTLYTNGVGLGLNKTSNTFYNTGVLSLELKGTSLQLSKYSPTDGQYSQNIDLEKVVKTILSNLQKSNTPFIKSGTENGTINVNGENISIFGLGELAYLNLDDISEFVITGGSSEINIGSFPKGTEKLFINYGDSTFQYKINGEYLTTYPGIIISNNMNKPWELSVIRPPKKEIEVSLSTGLFADGLQLENAEDLNNKISSGIFISKNSTVSSSLLNSPVTNSGFKIIVLDGYNSEVRHQFLSDQNNLYFRTYVKGRTNSWGKWSLLNNPEIVDNLSSTSIDKPLSANQGKILNETKVSKKTTTITLNANNWSLNSEQNYTQTITISGISGTGDLVVSSSPDTFIEYAEALVRADSQSGKAITFLANTKPQKNLSVYVMEIN